VSRVFAVSDSTGQTAEQVLRAALAQFEGAELDIERRSEIRSESQVLQVVEEAAQTRSLVVHTLVNDRLRDAMLRAGRLHDVETVDLILPPAGAPVSAVVHLPCRKAGSSFAT